MTKQTYNDDSSLDNTKNENASKATGKDLGKTINIRAAEKSDCYHLARLALIAGEGIPAFFWAQNREAGQSLEDVGAQRVSSSEANFSYRNALVATIEEEVVAMVLGYVLPEADDDDDLTQVPDFIRPLIELELQVPGSFYINMLAVYSNKRGQGIGTQLLHQGFAQAKLNHCDVVSLQVFEQNAEALKLYLCLGFAIIDERIVIPHACHPYTGKVLLLTKHV